MRRQRGSVKPRLLATGAKVFDVQFRDVKGRVMWKRGFPSRAAASAYLDTVLPEIQRGTYVRVQPITFSEYTETWLKTRDIKPSTKAAYASLLKRRLRPAFGGKGLDGITTSDVNSWLAGSADLALKTRRNAVALLTTIFDDGVADHRLAANPMRSRTLQKPRAIHAEDESDDIEILNTAEVNQVLDALPPEAYPLFLLLCSSGLRLGEALALRWSDVDSASRRLRVRRSVHKGVFYVPKSKRSKREVDVGDQLLAMLAAVRRERYGDELPPADALCFSNDEGKALDADNVRNRWWLPGISKGRVRHATIHSLRHFYTASLIEQGENLRYISEQLGHHSPAFTLKVYGGLLPGTRRDAAAKLEQQLGRACILLANAEKPAETGADGPGLTTRKSIQAETNGDQ